MSFLSSFGKRPPPKTSQVSRPTPAKPVSQKAPAAPAPAPAAQPKKPSSNGMRSRADALKAPKPRHSSPASSPSRRKNGHLASALQSDRKRKSATPTTPQFASDSEEEADLDDILHAKKKTKHDAGRIDKLRKIRDVAHWQLDSAPANDIISGADLTSTDMAKELTSPLVAPPTPASPPPTMTMKSEFKPAFPDADQASAVVELQYPNATTPERFQLAIAKKDDGYSALRDIVETVEQVLRYFLPTDQIRELLDDMTGIPRRLRKAVNSQDLDSFKRAIEEYNGLLVSRREDGTIQTIMDGMHSIPFELFERILDQVTVRTVSPYSETLRDYESFSSNTYGELREEFNSLIFRETGMDSSSVFIDLGSGVGNVVLQAALEMGCESYGIEMMPNPCKLARAQAKEFSARCRMWGLSTGRVELLDGDFLEDERLAPILAKVDVVLINNELFSSDLNNRLRARFLDLREGAKIVSLKSFVPPGWRLTERTSEDPCGVLEVEKKEYWSGCVSWTSRGGSYYISTKDSARIERILGGGT